MAGGERVNRAKKITLRDLVSVLEGNIAWMKVYPDRKHEEAMASMDWDSIREAVAAYGDLFVHSVYPGYHFVFV